MSACRRSAVGALVGALIPFVGCLAQSSVAPDARAAAFARRIAGCYHLDDGPWRADSVGVRDVSTASTPLDFELTTTLQPRLARAQSPALPFFVARKPGLDEESFDFTYWQQLDTADTRIRVASSPLMFNGIALTLAPSGSDLVGSVIVFTDVAEQDKPVQVTRPVRARRVACPAS